MVIMNNANTTERLIQEVRARPPLWDQRNLNYHNRVVVNALWQDIAELLQINKETVKVKWKGLRDTYRRELKKQRSNANAGNITENIRDPSWTHYSSMNFLREYMGNNNSHSDIFQFHGWSAEEMQSADEASTNNDEALNSFVPTASIMDLVGNNTTTPSDKSNDSALSDEELIKTNIKAEPMSLEMEKETSPSLQDKNQKIICAKKSKSGKKKRSTSSRLSHLKGHHRIRSKMSRKHSKGRHHSSYLTEQPYLDTNALVASISTPGHNSTRTSISPDESDDDLHFFKSLIPYVRNLPPTRKLYLRAEIHNLVLRELMSDGSSNSVIPLEHVAVGLNA